MRTGIIRIIRFIRDPEYPIQVKLRTGIIRNIRVTLTQNIRFRSWNTSDGTVVFRIIRVQLDSEYPIVVKTGLRAQFEAEPVWVGLYPV